MASGQSSILAVLKATVKRRPWAKGGVRAIKALRAEWRRRKAAGEKKTEFDSALLELGGSGCAVPVTDGLAALTVFIRMTHGPEHALRCLGAISRHPPKTSYSAILIGVFDERAKALLEGFNCVESHSASLLETLRHTIGDQGSDLMLVLDDGCVPLPGAIDALLNMAARHPDVHFLAPKIVTPDGAIFDAGGRTDAAGHFIDYGRGDDGRLSRYNYVRSVPSVSALAFLARRRAFKGAGAAKLAADRVALACLDDDKTSALYQPKAVTVYAGDDGLPRPMNCGQPAEKTFTLILDLDLPMPDRDAGSRTLFEFHKTLALAGRKVKFWPHNGNADPVYCAPLEDMGIEVVTGPLRPSFSRWLRENGSAIEAVLISRPDTAEEYLAELRKVADVPIVYYGHDVHFQRMLNQESLVKSPGLKLRARDMEKLEEWIWRTVDVTVYLSIEEIEVVRKRCPGATAQLIKINCYDDFDERREVPANQDILFVGGFRHEPNIDAALWFAKDVFPLVLRQKPQARFVIVGSYPTAEINALAGTHVEVAGWVTDRQLIALYDSARAVVVPLRFGAGVKLKVIEGIKSGVPLVTTPVGAQGLKDIECLMTIAETPETISQAVVDVLDMAADAWLAHSERQISFAKKNFSRAAMLQSLDEAFLAAAKVRGSHYPSSLEQSSQ